MQVDFDSSRTFAGSFIDYLNESCTNFHAIEASCKLLTIGGFVRISETEEWKLLTGGKYFFTRNATSVIAFTVGGAYIPGNGYTILGAHSDSPCLKIKPVTCNVKSDALMLNTQPYGGGLWHTWFDRDLGVAGRIITQTDGILKTKLVRIDKPIARIPNLAIHLTSGTERDAFKPNLQDHAMAILSMDPNLVSLKASSNDTSIPRLHPALLELVAPAGSGLELDEIVDLELQLIDVQPSTIGGASNDLIFSGRLDNLCSSYQIIRALIDGSCESLETQPNIRMAMMFDHEEVL
jgi:aspartyl aminopeptidase